ncbi:FG-GAP-like repeat-containing protein [Streptomyces sp. NBC_00879]|uniref:FG-GAP-like repeat-containing protein n=1 Tax=Streptomyces sp. NBC_00879 TaxID=2975855 RepID=UPI0038640F12|nr:FG-GAP-like repeat-containing protein [Streptomyces sp. NBC_00879]
MQHTRPLRLSALAAALLAATVALSAVPAAAMTGSAPALSGADAPSQLNYVAKINVGEQTACTGTLVDPQWVLSAATCFAADGKPPAGKPAITTTVTIGRTDLTQTNGSVQQAIALVPHADRDLVLVRLATRITDPAIKPVPLATTPAADNEQLTVAGFGRTKTEWVPSKLHTGTFTVASTTNTTVDLNGSDTATVCKGDAGGPALRTANGTPELVAINSRSWQGGCLGTDAAETRTGAISARVDDLGAWIKVVTSLSQQDLMAGDYNGDGITDLFSTDARGQLSVWTGNKGGSFNSPRMLTDGWDFTQNVAASFTAHSTADLIARNTRGELLLWTGSTTGTFSAPKKITGGWDFTQTVAGDFTGDGKADLIAKDSSGNLYLWPGNGDGTFSTRKKVTGGWDFTQTVAGDFTGDGKADLIAKDSSGNLYLWPGNGDGTFSTRKKLTGGWDFTQTVAGDFAGDGKADLIARNDATGTLYRWSGHGDGTFAAPVRLTDSW